MIWFTSDLHFSHKRACFDFRYKSNNEKFSSLEEMNYHIIDTYNQYVSDNDEVYLLGDISFAKIEETKNCVSALKGNKHLIIGNHDKKFLRNTEFRNLFRTVNNYKELVVTNPQKQRQMIVLCHFPMLVWDESHYGSIMLHGHCHGNLIYPFEGRIMDVGVDPNNFKPVSLDEVFKLNEIEPHKIEKHNQKAQY